MSPAQDGTMAAGTADTGNHCDDCATGITLPFPYEIYNHVYTAAFVTSNGQLDFADPADTAYYNRALPDANAHDAIFAYWADLRTDQPGGGVFTSVSGEAPHRIFTIKWRAVRYGANTPVTFELRLYEGMARFDLIYGALDHGGGSATVGVQRDTGGSYTQYEYNSAGSLATGLALSFTINGGIPLPTETLTPTDTPLPTETLTPTDTPLPTGTPTDTPTSTPTPYCPASWQCADVGNPLTAGSSNLDDNGAWTLKGAGNDIWNDYDQFQFAAQSLTGDGAITARITTQADTADCAKAGVMVRDGAGLAAVNYAAVTLPRCALGTQGVQVNYRSETGGGATSNAGTLGMDLPLWLRIVRRGNTLTSYTSPDGTTWATVPGSEQTLNNLPATALFGLVVSSNNGDTASTATFDHVSIDAAPPEPTAAATATPTTGPTALPYQLLAINSGGDTAGSFVADTDVLGGNTFGTGAAIDTNGVSGAAPESVYQSERWGNFTYTIPNLTPGAAYTVRLHFAEIVFTQSGQRVFDVALNGAPVLTNFDIIAAAGGRDKAIVEQFNTTANDAGHITIAYTGVVDNAKSSGIEILSLPPGPATATPAATDTPTTEPPTATATDLPFATATSIPHCPAPWQCADIGNPAAAGSSNVDDNGTWTLAGSGSDIWYDHDAFQYAAQSLTGDARLSLHVTSQTDTNDWAKAGIMFRASTEADAPYYFLCATSEHGLHVQYRSTRGAYANDMAVPTGSLPVYLQVTRIGNTFMAYTSTDGVQWIAVPDATMTIEMGNTVRAGMAVTSHNDGTASVATFDAVEVGVPAPTATPLPTETSTPTATPQPINTATEAPTTTATSSPTATQLPRPDDGLTHWWPGEGTGADAIGSATEALGNIGFAAGRVGQAFSFDGTGSSADFGSTAGNFGGGDFTIQFWIATTGGGGRGVLGKRPVCDNANFWDIRSSGNGLGLEMDENGSNYFWVTTTKTLNDGAFHLVTFVRRGTVVSAYTDGTFDARNSAPGVTYMDNGAALVAGRSACTGAELQGDGTGWFNGQLDEIKLYSRALSDSEIASAYSDAGPGGNPGTTPTATATPQRDACAVIEAASADAVGGNTVVLPDGLHHFDGVNSSWARYKGVDFSHCGDTFAGQIAHPADGAGQHIELHLDSPAGPLLGSLTVQSTGSWGNYREQTTSVVQPSGTHDLYLVANGSWGVANIGSFHFVTTSPAPPVTPTSIPPSTTPSLVPPSTTPAPTVDGSHCGALTVGNLTYSASCGTHDTAFTVVTNRPINCTYAAARLWESDGATSVSGNNQVSEVENVDGGQSDKTFYVNQDTPAGVNPPGGGGAFLFPANIPAGQYVIGIANDCGGNGSQWSKGAAFGLWETTIWFDSADNWFLSDPSGPNRAPGTPTPNPPATSAPTPSPTPVGGGIIPWHAHYTVRLSDRLRASVDLADGHLDLQADDMALPGRGPGFALSHTWDSRRAQAGLSGTAGRGWQTSLDAWMSGVLTGTVWYTDASGATWPFTYTGALSRTGPYTTYQTPPGLPWQLSGTTDGYTLTNILSGQTRSFDAQGRWVADTDTYGQSTTLVADPLGLNGLLATSSGRALSLLYEGPGRLAEVASPQWTAGADAQSPGQHVTYGYDGAGQLISLTWGAGTAQPQSAQFAYDPDTGLFTSVTTPATSGSLSMIPPPARSAP